VYHMVFDGDGIYLDSDMCVDIRKFRDVLNNAMSFTRCIGYLGTFKGNWGHT
jgi:hypothetical protein